jgi:beta-lactamase regulating signal transducer with metallopeptidase domain
MNSLLQSLASEEWALVVKALLHTLWLGGIVAGGLYFILRGKIDPVARYRWCVGALLAVVLGGIVAWAMLQPQPQPVVDHPSIAMTSVAVAAPAGAVEAAVVTAGPMVAAQSWQWTSWLALVWLGGMAAMLARAGSLVVEAEQLRKRSRPLADEAVLKLIEEARRKLGLMRRIQVVVTEQLTSPAVMGLVTPVLILPLAMVTTLPVEQLQLILLHELAHIRRGDYLVNLGQLLAESLLFFNPAVWWISRQIRQEREACCDAAAIALAGERLQYARTLAQVAGSALAAAPAFSDKRNPSGLKDRIQRLLVPGYRPALRLTWRALLASLFVGGGLLFLSAMGARTVAAILSPQERIARIEKKMTELGQAPVPGDANGNVEKAAQVEISGRVRTADGSPVPDWIFLNTDSVMGNSSSGGAQYARHGSFSNSVPGGTIYIGAEITNFAPVFIRPLDGRTTNRFENLEIILQRGFDVPLQLVDAEDGRSLTGAKATTMFWMNNMGYQSHSWESSADGSLTLTHCADYPMTVTVNVPGYEILQKRVEHLHAGEPLRLELRRGTIVSGVVLDKATGQPVAGAELHLLYQTGTVEPLRFEWNDSLHILGKTDAHGAFALNQLRGGGARYYLGVTAPGHETIRLENIVAGQSNLVVRTGPELVVRGRVIGNLELLRQVDDGPTMWLSRYEKYGDNSYGDGANVPILTESGVSRFQFTNRLAGLVKLDAGGQTFERTVDAPVDDWVIDLGRKTPKSEAKDVPKREVIFRFTHSSGVSPGGTVEIQIPDNLEKDHLTAHNLEMEITNDEVRAQIPIGGQTAIEPKRMVGYWFNRFSVLSIEVTNGPGPLVVEIPLIPAGAIYAKGRNADGTPAGGLLFGVSELKRAPGVDQSSLLGSDSDGFSDNAPRHWVSGPLPLGGTYQIHAWRGYAFCVSQPVKLTEANPDAEIELQFAPGKTFAGVLLGVDGKPLPDAELKVSFTLTDISGFGLKSVFTDERGQFQIEDTTPERGQYTVEYIAPGVMDECMKLDFDSQPQTFRLKRGRSLAGRVVQAHTGYAIPDVDVTAADFDDGVMPTVKMRTDADGRFAFNTLGDFKYSFIFGDGQLLSDEKFHANGNTNVVLPLKLYEWSKAKPKAP